MDSALGLLKEEINQTFRDQHDLAKWKLIATASIATAAIGLNSQASEAHKDILPWLFLFIPLVCAYVDMLAYQYQMRIMVLSNYICTRKYVRGKYDDPTLVEYEKYCRKIRAQTAQFSYGNLAGVMSSLIASAGALAGFFLLSTALRPRCCFGVIWYAGICLIVQSRSRFHSDEKRCETDPAEEKILANENQSTPARRSALAVVLCAGMNFLLIAPALHFLKNAATGNTGRKQQSESSRFTSHERPHGPSAQS